MSSLRLRLRGLLLTALVLSLSFAGGWEASRKLTTEPTFYALAQSVMTSHGDAPLTVRAGVLATLDTLQAAYARRDPTTLPDLMRRCFDPNLSILVIGTDPAEWVDGYAKAEHFIAHDWSSWGDARLDLADAAISSAGSTAW